LLSTSTLASTHEPPPSTASFSSTGESCLHGPHHSAQKSTTTGEVRERSSTSDWKVASVTSITVTPPGAPAGGLPPTPPGGPPAWAAAAGAGPAGAGGD